MVTSRVTSGGSSTKSVTYEATGSSKPTSPRATCWSTSVAVITLVTDPISHSMSGFVPAENATRVCDASVTATTTLCPGKRAAASVTTRSSSSTPRTLHVIRQAQPRYGSRSEQDIAPRVGSSRGGPRPGS